MEVKGFAAFVLALVLTGCSGGGGDGPKVAAVVEGVEIPASETEALLRTHVKAQADQDEEEPSRERLLRFVLIYQIKHAYLDQLAAQMGVTVEGQPEDDVAAQVAPPEAFEAAGFRPEDKARDARAGRLSKAIAEKLFPEITIPEDALRQEYEQRAAANDSSWQVSAKVAAFTSETQARQVGPRVQQGEPFEDAASALGALDVETVEISPLSPLPQPVLDAVGKLRPAEVSPPIQVSTTGWASILVERRDELPKFSFEEVRADLTQFLTDEQRQGLFQQWFAKKLRTARIRVDEHYGRWDRQAGTVR